VRTLPQVLDHSVTKMLLEIGNTAAVYVDLGSGQTVVYLLAIAANSSLECVSLVSAQACHLSICHHMHPLISHKLHNPNGHIATTHLLSLMMGLSALQCDTHHHNLPLTHCECAFSPSVVHALFLSLSSFNFRRYLLIHDVKSCFVDLSESERQTLRDDFVATFASVSAQLDDLGSSVASLFHICIAGTAKYREIDEQGGEEGKEKLREVEAWFRSVISDSGLDSVDRGDRVRNPFL
jgi:hypothetical protein